MKEEEVAGGRGAETVDLVGKCRLLISVPTNTEEHTTEVEDSKEQLFF